MMDLSFLAREPRLCLNCGRLTRAKIQICSQPGCMGARARALSTAAGKPPRVQQPCLVCGQLTVSKLQICSRDSCSSARTATWRSSPRGKAWQKSYTGSPAQKASRDAYNKTPKARATRDRYSQGDKATAGRKAYKAGNRLKELMLGTRRAQFLCCGTGALTHQGGRHELCCICGGSAGWRGPNQKPKYGFFFCLKCQPYWRLIRDAKDQVNRAAS